jgi:hypothetical protein
MACFGSEEEISEILKYGRLTVDKQNIIFPTDALIVMPSCSAHFAEIEIVGYVFIKGHLLSFTGAD